MARKAIRKNRPGRTGEEPTGIADVLGRIPGITVTANGDELRVRCERIGVAMNVDPRRVLGQQLVTDPFGDPALLLLLDVAGTPVQVVVSSSDLVFQPDDSVRIGDFKGPPISVENMPPMVGYSEVLRDLATCEGTIAAETNVDRLFGTLAMLRYFLAGAERLDIDCAGITSRWQSLWQRFSKL